MLAQATSSDNRRGILLMLVAMSLFVANDAFMKLATAAFPTSQMMAVRGTIASGLGLALVVAMGEARRLPDLLQPFVVGRALAESCVAFLFITALAIAPLANLTAILQATPIILTLILVVAGLERVGWRRWIAILVGFSGVLLIVRPGPDGFDPSAFLALGAALLMAFRDLFTRLVRIETPTVVVALGTLVAVTLAGFAIGAVRGDEWASVGRIETLWLAIAAMLVVTANVTLVAAFRKADMSVVSPFRYSSVVYATIIGFALFDEFPDAISLTGFVLVVGAGIYAWWREQVRRSEAAAPLASSGARIGDTP